MIGHRHCLKLHETPIHLYRPVCQVSSPIPLNHLLFNVSIRRVFKCWVPALLVCALWILDTLDGKVIDRRVFDSWGWVFLLPSSSTTTERHSLDLRRRLGQWSPPTAPTKICRIHIIDPCQCQLFLVVSQLFCEMFPITRPHASIRDSSISPIFGSSGYAATAEFDAVSAETDTPEYQDGPEDDEY